MMIARGGESIEKPFRPSLLSRLSSSYLLRQLGDGLGVDGLLLVVGGHGASSRWGRAQFFLVGFFRLNALRKKNEEK